MSPYNLVAKISFSQWQGRWDGTCLQNQYNTENVKTQSETKMTLEIKELDNDQVSWVINYFGEPPRNYTMRKSNTNLEGHYVLDENNGILIDRFKIKNEIRDLFQVNGKKIFTTTTLEENTIKIVTNSFWQQPLRTTSLPDGSFKVNSFALRDVSHCHLIRK